MSTDKNKFYIKKEEMHAELVKSRDAGRATEKLGKMFMMLCEKYSHDHKFRDYERRYGRAFKEDLLSAGLIACCRAWPKFDPDKWDNPFAFFTTCIRWEFINFLEVEYNYSNAKNVARLANGMEADHGFDEMMKKKEAKRLEKKRKKAEEEGRTLDIDKPKVDNTDSEECRKKISQMFGVTDVE